MIFFFNSYDLNSNALQGLTVHAGTNLLSETGAVYKVKQAISHSGYNAFKLVNDIGILILKNPIKFSERIQPIPLATTDIAPTGSPCTLTGWGRTSVSIKQKLFII